MRQVAALVIGCVAACLATSSVQAGDVCNYSVTSTIGTCPFFPGATACLPTSAATGPCNAAVECFGHSLFFCRVTLAPKSGPRAQCAAGSRRLTGFSCFRPPGQIPTQTPTASPTPTVNSGTIPPTLLEHRLYRAADGTAYQLVSVPVGSAAEVRITAMAGSQVNTGGCQLAGGPLAGAAVQATVGVLQGLGTLIPFEQIVRTAVFTPNDLAAIAFDPNLSGRLAVGTGAGAVTVCSSAPDCAGQPNLLPLTGLDSATGGVPAACIANGTNAGCDLANLRNAFAFGLSSTGHPPTCTDPSSVTVNTTLCAPAPTDGFTLHQGEAIVFVHDHFIGDVGYAAGVAGFGVSPVAVGFCSSGGVVGSTTRFDSTP